MAKTRGRLKDIRTKAGLTYQQVADAVGITKEYYWQLENGKRNLYYELAVRIAGVFGHNPDEIFLSEELTNKEHASA